MHVITITKPFLFIDFQNFSSTIDNVQVDVLKPLKDDINKVHVLIFIVLK